MNNRGVVVIHTYNGDLYYDPEAIEIIYDLHENHGIKQRSKWIDANLWALQDFDDIRKTVDSKLSSREIGIARYLNKHPYIFYPALTSIGITCQSLSFYISCRNNGTDVLLHVEDHDLWVPLESKMTGAKLEKCATRGAGPKRGRNLFEGRQVKHSSKVKLHPVNGEGSKDDLVLQILQKYFHDHGLFFSHYRGPETDYEEVFTDIIFVERDVFNDIIMLHHKLNAGENHLSWDGITIQLDIASFYNKFATRCVILQTLHP